MAEGDNPGGGVPTKVEAKPNDVIPPATMSLEDINKRTGRTYGTLDEALKGIEDTFKHVGSKEIIKEVVKEIPPDPNKFVSREEFQTAEFFRTTPEANKHKDLLETIAKANGMKPQDVFNGDPATNNATKYFKDVSAKVNVADETTNARSALTSTARLGVVGDASTKAKDAFEQSQKARASGDLVGAQALQREAETQALAAVIGAYGLEGKKVSD